MGDAKPVRRWTARDVWAVPVLLAAYLATQYGYAWRVPFLNDDFVFLDVTRGASFLSLWSPRPAVWLWYRPWSRELHYWTLQGLFGTEVAPYHLASFALWLALMGLYWRLARHLTGARAAGISTAGVAALAAWGLPLVWIAGVQDLWMMTLALGALLAFLHARRVLAMVLFALALLSKETAALVPFVAFVLTWRVERRPLRTALSRTAPLLAVAAAWAFLHPLLGGRLWQAAALPPASVANAGLASVASRTLLAMVNLDGVPRPEFGWSGPLLLGAAGALCLVGLAAVALRPRGGRCGGPAREPAGPAGGLAALAGAWALAGWLPLLMPSVGWHAYYGLFGMLGAWLLLGAWLARRPALALSVVAVLTLLRPLQAATVSRDWGDEWYQGRAAEFIDFMRRDLLAKVPAVPPHSRFYFVDVPSNVGFLQGDGPALRVWFREPTVSGALFSQYRARRAGLPAGPDRFFRYDSTAGWIEVHRGPEEAASARAADPLWREDHERLAAALSRGGDWPGTAAEYAKLAAAFPDSVDYLYYAGLAASAAGDLTAARTWLVRAAALPGADDEVRTAARRLGADAAAAPRGRVRGAVRR
jgi:hypothetical protein